MKQLFTALLFFATSWASAPQQSTSAVLSAFSGHPTQDRHLTPHLLEIAKHGHELNANERMQLEAIGFNFNFLLVSRSGAQRSEAVGLDQYYDDGIFRFHFTTTGRNAVNISDDNNDGIPNYIDSVSVVFNQISNGIHKVQGYLMPPSDGFYSGNRDKGGSEHYDVYIRNLSSRYYGYTQPEEFAQGKGDNERSKTVVEINAFTSYMVIRNNYNNFPLSELENIKVTAAHEYYHAIQFGYDGWEMPWLLEASAVWMEEEMYDNINDCYQYMGDWFSQPQRALDEDGFHWYGSFIFFEYIEQHMGGAKTIRRIFDESVRSNSQERDGSHSAINASLKQQGYSFQQALNGMSVANKIMSSLPAAENFAYEEAEGYPVNGPAIMKKVNFQTGNRDTVSSTRLSRFASQYIQIITQKPVQVDLYNMSGPISDLQLNAILKKNDNSYLVISSPSINIDPTDLKSIHLSIVSHDTVGGNWDYQITVQDGKSGTDANIPVEFTIGNPYPNPFNGNVQFSLYMMKETPISINVLNLNGKRIAQLYNGALSPGNHNFHWQGKNSFGVPVSSGVYYIKVSGKSTEEWRPITFVK
ncbi:MAG: T9SS type A sorting domain-containing protein [Candidatus Marinimicrobia bacterium]|nr:T9SS type A sorting domain-containing protein [Candidatus Neomarinimicrobiota bacterium]MBL7029879.1 T9SS type A sorting domain-containing protein [Candidatus Neomarinimicrobiota bacterium]